MRCAGVGEDLVLQSTFKAVFFLSRISPKRKAVIRLQGVRRPTSRWHLVTRISIWIAQRVPGVRSALKESRYFPNSRI